MVLTLTITLLPLLGLGGMGEEAVAAGEGRVIGLKLVGLERTDPAWLESYIDYHFPLDVSAEDLRDLERKLITTSVFTSVQASLIPSPDVPTRQLLQVEVQERWTLIPVVRAAYGGGTPLKVFGAYDIHALGRLLILGAEARQYGSAPPGFVVYGRDPRGDSDRYYLGGELWREFRRRQVIDAGGTVVGALSSNMTMSRLRLLVPFATDERTHAHDWKYGGDLEAVQEAPSVYDPDLAKTSRAEPPPGIALNTGRRLSWMVLPTLLYDDIAVNHIEYHGLRARIKYGPVFASGRTYSFGEGEVDYYRLLGASWNLALRAVAGQSTFASLQSEYFLGGLDTIRGLPDGAIYGTHAAYTNVEMRHITLKTHYLWLQSALFVDAGGAGDTWVTARDTTRATAGIGLRFAVPQVYRLMLRVDYAWSLTGPQAQGITAGLNQFFDPYIPL